MKEIISDTIWEISTNPRDSNSVWEGILMNRGILEGFERLARLVIDVVNETSSLVIRRCANGHLSVYGRELDLTIELKGDGTFHINATVYKDGYIKSHALETNDSEAALNYVYYLVGITDPQRGKWIKL